MSAQLLVRAAGPGVTIQDAGRFGLARFGVTPAGPMDEAAFLTATRAVGATAALEVSLGGVTLEAQGATLAIALAGGAFDARLENEKLPDACVIALAPGARLAIRAGASGAWRYVAVGARFDLPPTLGSLATHARAALGPRPLAAGDALSLLDLSPPPLATRALAAPWLTRDEAPIRVMLGPQDDYFAPETIAEFLNATWRIDARSDRMAYALDGPRLKHRRGHDVISDGAAMGAVQIPGSGAPFVLMADRQPTGGYPKIATVIGADLGRLAQVRPGEALRFRRVTWDEAVEARRALRHALDAAAADGPRLTSESLLMENLVGGVISARD